MFSLCLFVFHCERSLITIYLKKQRPNCAFSYRAKKKKEKRKVNLPTYRNDGPEANNSHSRLYRWAVADHPPAAGTGISPEVHSCRRPTLPNLTDVLFLSTSSYDAPIMRNWLENTPTPQVSSTEDWFRRRTSCAPVKTTRTRWRMTNPWLK